MAYINTIPLPFCNASRYCEIMAEDSTFYDMSQTTNRLFRLAAHALLIFLTAITAIESSRTPSGGSTISGFIFVGIVALFVVTYFISLHADIAEGILTSIFIEEKLTQQDVPLERKQLMQPPEIVK